MQKFDREHAKEYTDTMDTDGKIAGTYLPYVDNILSRIDYSPQCILDIGSGPGIVPILLAEKLPSARIIGVDNSRYMVRYAKNKTRELKLDRVQFELGDAQALKFENDMFDLVLCKGVLKMVPDKPLFLKETWRVLRPKGCAFISDLRRDGKEEFEKSSSAMPENERERLRSAIDRSLTVEELKELLKESELAEHSEIQIEGYRYTVKISKD